MSAEDTNPEDQWPLPPAWMWDCDECVRLYAVMKRVQAAADERWLTGKRGVDWDPMDSAVGAEINLARHLSAAHEENLPDWDPECATCEYHTSALAQATAASSTGAAMVAAEHRARHLFVPLRSVGLM